MNTPRIVLPVLSRNVDNYVNALKRAGAIPVIVSDLNSLHIDETDGLLLPGGVDINPARYSRDNAGSMEIDDRLDQLQFSVLKMFVEKRKPVLGICRGHQLINVYFGGTLNQNILTHQKHEHSKVTGDQYHEADSLQDTWIHSLYGNHFIVNSAHHQAVEKIGKHLHADLYSTDDHVVEGMHHTQLPVYSVQWHPERCYPSAETDCVNGDAVFNYFINVIKKMYSAGAE